MSKRVKYAIVKYDLFPFCVIHKFKMRLSEEKRVVTDAGEFDEDQVIAVLSGKSFREFRVRIGGEGHEVFYRVTLVVWVYDEDDTPYERVDVGVTKI